MVEGNKENNKEIGQIFSKPYVKVSQPLGACDPNTYKVDLPPCFMFEKGFCLRIWCLAKEKIRVFGSKFKLWMLCLEGSHVDPSQRNETTSYPKLYQKLCKIVSSIALNINVVFGLQNIYEVINLIFIKIHNVPRSTSRRLT